MIQFQKMQWLFPVAVALHNSEEAVWMPGWTSQHHIWLPFTPPGAGELRFALVLVTVAAFAVTHLSKRHGKQSFWAYIFFGYVMAMLVNVFVPHVGASLLYRMYTPGVITAVFVNLPVMSLLAVMAVRENWVSGEGRSFPRLWSRWRLASRYCCGWAGLFDQGSLLNVN